MLKWWTFDFSMWGRKLFQIYQIYLGRENRNLSLYMKIYTHTLIHRHIHICSIGVTLHFLKLVSSSIFVQNQIYSVPSCISLNHGCPEDKTELILFTRAPHFGLLSTRFPNSPSFTLSGSVKFFAVILLHKNLIWKTLCRKNQTT